MADPKKTAAANPNSGPTHPLVSVTPMRRTTANQVFAFIYACAILALFYHHVRRLLLLRPATVASVCTTLSLMIADAILAFGWSTTQSFRMFPVRWKEYPENLRKVVPGDDDFPAVDVFICTADPFKEPPIGVVNTALSVMGYEYPANKVSVYVSDDGGSELTLFALMEAAKFAREWLPFCRRNKLMERSPDAYFSSNRCSSNSEAEKIKMMYENMKMSVENVVERGKVGDEYISRDDEREALRRWTDGFTKQNHPAIVQVVSDSSKDRDIAGDSMPNLIYVSREKNTAVHHHFKAGALNALLRVSAVMTNAPVILTLDCDTRSNDPETLDRVLCYLFDPLVDQSKLGYIQFPQRFQGINRDDIYSGDYKRLYQLNPTMRDGPKYVGTGCFFCRRSFFGRPGMFLAPEIPELSPDHRVKKPMRSQEIMELAHRVASCNYEDKTNWGSKVGFSYGSLSEDFFTGYRLQREGWKAIFCHPDRAAFLGDAPIALIDVLNQNKRWAIGLQQVAYSKYSPVTFGVRSMGLLMGLSYCHDAFWPILSIPMTIYAFLPQLALINGVSIFPKVSEPWFLLYLFLFFGAYGPDLVDFILAGHEGTFRRWWNDQRMWLIRGLTSYLFGSVEYALKSVGVSMHGFNVTDKIADDEKSKKYMQGVFDFGSSSPMFVSLSTAATVNLTSLLLGLTAVAVNSARRDAVEGLMLQFMLAGFGVVNSLPLYEAMFLRSDKGRLPTTVTFTAVSVASLLCTAASVVARGI